MKKVFVIANNQLVLADIAWNLTFPCAIGRNGMIDAAQKREGDGASPIGIWPMRRVFYRPDRLDAPETGLPLTELKPDMGWCDAPDDRNYNRLVTLPYSASHEALWREDHVYDIIVELAHNDSPPAAHLGSAIFMHVAKPGYTPTQGCAALAKEDLLRVLAVSNLGDCLEFRV